MWSSGWISRAMWTAEMEQEQRMGMGKEEDRNGIGKAKKAWQNCWKAKASGAVDCLGWKRIGTTARWTPWKGWAGLDGAGTLPWSVAAVQRPVPSSLHYDPRRPRPVPVRQSWTARGGVAARPTRRLSEVPPLLP